MVEPQLFFPAPAGRAFAACASEGGSAYLFGGTDALENMCDLWVFRSHPEVMRWVGHFVCVRARVSLYMVCLCVGECLCVSVLLCKVCLSVSVCAYA